MSNCKTTDDFISDARRVHGDKYDYSLCEYIKSSKKVTIVCNKHGPFQQTPNNHLNGSGCRACGYEKLSTENKLSQDDVISRFSDIHGDLYDYRLVKYKDNRTKIAIICRDHGVFEQSPSDHIGGHGCAKCARMDPLTTLDFINRSNLIHDFAYDYSCTKYKRSLGKVKIKCRKHGVFEQQAASHLSGHACPKCAKYGFDYSSVGFVYFLISENGSDIKVGITNNLTQRVKKLTKVTPFRFSLFKYYELPAEVCRIIENYYLSKYQNAKKRGFDGCTEWLKYSKELMSEIMGA